jgi:predicted CoA-binding protein
MARAKMIKEIEVKFSPAFDKAINGVKTTKKAKTTTKKATKAKATAKPKAVKVTKVKAPRGYKIVPVQKELTLDGVKAAYELYEVTGKGLDKPRVFVTEEHAQRFVEQCQLGTVVEKALLGKGYSFGMGHVVKEMSELKAAEDLPELDTELPEKCDKHSIEDIDA